MDPYGVAYLESTAKPQKRMVYMVCGHFPGCENRTYSIFALDISKGVETNNDESPIRLPEPFFKFGDSYPLGMGFFSLGNKIYSFGGLSDSSLCHPLDTYVFDTSEKTVVKGPFLKAPKFCPIVIHLNQMVYVISLSLNKSRSPPPHFEVFNPDLQTWERLPEPSFDASSSSLAEGRRLDAYLIHAHAVLGTTIYISMAVGIYSFDVEKPNKGWIYLPAFSGVSEFPFLQNAELVNEHWLSLIRGCDGLVLYDPHEENGLTEGQGFYSISRRLPWNNQILLFSLGNSELCMANSWCNKDTGLGTICVKGARLFYEFSVFQTGRFMEFEERPKKVAKQDTHGRAPLCTPCSYKVAFMTDDFDMMSGTIVGLFPIKM